MRIVICGGSSTAEYLARNMTECHRRHRITIIEKDLETMEHLAEVLPARVTIVYGDGCDPEIQRDAGLAETDLFIALTTHDEVNLVACELAMVNFEVPRTIANVSSPKNKEIFEMLGIEPVSATALIARMVEEEAVMGDVRMVFSLKEGDITITELKMPFQMENEEGIMVQDLPVEAGARLIAVVRDGEFVMVDMDTVLKPGETIVAAVKSDYEEEFRGIMREL